MSTTTGNTSISRILWTSKLDPDRKGFFHDPVWKFIIAYCPSNPAHDFECEIELVIERPEEEDVFIQAKYEENTTKKRKHIPSITHQLLGISREKGTTKAVMYLKFGVQTIEIY